MRILFTCFADRSHFGVMVPLIWAARTAGHDVVVATQPALVDTVANAGLPVASIGRNHRLYENLERLSHLETDSGAPAFGHPFGFDPVDIDDVSDEEVLAGWAAVTTYWWRTVNDPMLDDLVTFCGQWTPDLLVWESTTFAGMIAATVHGVPHVRFAFGMDLAAAVAARVRTIDSASAEHDALLRWLSARIRHFGGTLAPPTHPLGMATVNYLPPELHEPPGHQWRSARFGPRIHTRYVPYNGRSVIPQWLRRPPTRSRVCVTLGTSSIERYGSVAVSIGRLLDGLASLDVEVVATIGAVHLNELGPMPDNVRIESFVPLDALAAGCDLVVDHGGSATICTVARHGVPQLVVPAVMFDEHLLARRLAATGASLTIDASLMNDAHSITDAALRVLSDRSFRDGAASLRASLAAMPSPYVAVKELLAIGRNPPSH